APAGAAAADNSPVTTAIRRTAPLSVLLLLFIIFSDRAFIILFFLLLRLLSKPKREVISANDPVQPARERLGLFGCAATFASSASKCQWFCHFMPEKRVRSDLSKRQSF